MPKELIEFEGDLYCYPTGSHHVSFILRPKFRWFYVEIKNGAQLRATIRSFSFSDKLYQTSDGESLCEVCVAKEYSSIVYSIRHKCNDGWRVVGVDVVDDFDGPIFCSHCGKVMVEDWKDNEPAATFLLNDGTFLSF